MSKKTERRRVVREELEGVSLRDKRRSKRAVAIGERLAEAPEASLPAAMGDRAGLEALYRHLASDSVTMDALLEPHLERSAKRIAQEPIAYAVADTTDFVFTGASKREGLGRVTKKDQGFLAHFTLAVRPDRTPVGLLGLETWTRAPKKGDASLWSRRNDDGRESLRWARNMKAVSEHVGEHAAKLIHVADREGDIYELLAELTEAKQRFIIRASQDRALVPMDDEDARRLFDAAQATPSAFELDVPLSARAEKREPNRRRANPARRARLARLSFAARTVTLKRPTNRSAKLPRSVTVNVVYVFEAEPPAGEPPVEWLLLTSESVETNADVEKVVAGYRVRWVIEEFFKAIKTGCAYESRQLESAHTLQALLAYTIVIAYAMLLMRSLSRENRDEPAEVLLSSTQIVVLRARVKRLPTHPTIREALLAVAGMGGHLKNNGDPGWRTLSKGWAKLLALEEGYALALALAEK